MTHLDIVEQTPDRLVLRRQRSRGDQVVTGLVFATIVGFSVWALWLVAVSGDRLLAAGLIGFLALMGWMGLLKNRVTLDPQSDRLSVTQPLAWRWSKLSTHAVTVTDETSPDGSVAVLLLGPYVLARTGPHASAAEARAALADDAALIGRYRPRGGSDRS